MLAADVSEPAMTGADHSTGGTDTLVIVDPAVPELESLLGDIPEGAEIVLLNESTDAIDQIGEALVRRSELSSIHLISHGQSGELMLAGSSLDVEAIDNRRDDLRAWSNSLRPGGDILLYGCNVAEGEKGIQFFPNCPR